MEGQCRALGNVYDIVGMWATAPILSLHIFTHILRGNFCERSTDSRKNYGKGTGSQLPEFIVKSTVLFLFLFFVCFFFCDFCFFEDEHIALTVLFLEDTIALSKLYEL